MTHYAFYVKLILIGIAVIFSPLALAFGSSLINGDSMFNEGTGSGAYIWLMLVSVPTGVVMTIIGIIRLVFKKFPKN
jgi:hypothetical protein